MNQVTGRDFSSSMFPAGCCNPSLCHCLSNNDLPKLKEFTDDSLQSCGS